MLVSGHDTGCVFLKAPITCFCFQSEYLVFNLNMLSLASVSGSFDRHKFNCPIFPQKPGGLSLQLILALEHFFPDYLLQKHI